MLRDAITNHLAAKGITLTIEEADSLASVMESAKEDELYAFRSGDSWIHASEFEDMDKG